QWQKTRIQDHGLPEPTPSTRPTPTTTRLLTELILRRQNPAPLGFPYSVKHSTIIDMTSTFYTQQKKRSLPALSFGQTIIQYLSANAGCYSILWISRLSFFIIRFSSRDM